MGGVDVDETLSTCSLSHLLCYRVFNDVVTAAVSILQFSQNVKWLGFDKKKVAAD